MSGLDAGGRRHVLPADDPSSPAEDTLECLECDYNLTGVESGRCPECGTPFDRDALRELIRTTGGSLPWQRDPPLPGFVATWVQSITQPIAVARDFPIRHDRLGAASFSIICYAVAAFAVVAGSSRTIWAGMLAAFGGFVGCWFCETLTAAVLAVLMRPSRFPRGAGRYHFWRGLTHYTSGFTVLSGFWGGCALASKLTATPIPVLFFPAAALFVWWAVALCCMIVARGRGLFATTIGCLAVPTIGVAAIVVGYVAAAALALAPIW